METEPRGIESDKSSKDMASLRNLVSTRNFHFLILGFHSLLLEKAHANEINHDIHLANALF